MPFKLKYTLLCQSPIMHFQAKREEQFGAALRATEVKPKLDKFLTKKFGDSISLSWYINGKDGALNYKMHITPVGPQKTLTVHPIYYGNTGRTNRKKYPIFGNCELTIMCFIPELSEKINACIGEFFIVMNFGSMQSKGFGSYTVQGYEISEKTIEQYLKQSTGSLWCYKIDKNYSSKPATKSIKVSNEFVNSEWPACYWALDDIKKIYSVMKSGYNRSRPKDYYRDDNHNYTRSFLYMYFFDDHKKGVQRYGSEKAYMKKEKISPWLNGTPVKHPNNNIFDGRDANKFIEYKYLRAFLGIGETIEYIKSYNGEVPNSRDKQKVKIKCTDEEMQRLSSPIFFKIINGEVYITAKKLNDNIFGKEFEFSSNYGTLTNPQIKSGCLKVPTKEELKVYFGFANDEEVYTMMSDFLDFFVWEYNYCQRKSYGIDANILKVTEGRT